MFGNDECEYSDYKYRFEDVTIVIILTDIREYCNHPEELDDATVNPRYRGPNIPSRSFKVLQEMTGADGSKYTTPAFLLKAMRQKSEGEEETPARGDVTTPSSAVGMIRTFLVRVGLTA